MTTLGELTAQLGLDIKDFERKVKRVEKELKDIGQTGEKETKKVSKGFDNIGRSLRRLTGLYISFQTIRKSAEFGKEVALVAARYETLGVVLQQVGKNALYNTQELNRNVQSLEALGISMTQAREGTIKAVQAHIELSDSLKLARIAQDAAVIGNTNSSDAFGRLIRGIQVAEVELLKTIGINVLWENSYKKLAKELGKTQNSLTQSEKLQARLNIVIEKGVDIAGSYAAAYDTAGKKITSFTRFVDNFKVKMGVAFGPATFLLVDKATEVLKEFTKQIESPEAQEGLTQFADGIAAIGSAALTAANALGKLIKFAGLRSVGATKLEGILLSRQGLLDEEKFIQAGLFERQKMIDEVRKTQSESVNEFIESLRDSSLATSSYIEVAEEHAEVLGEVGEAARKAAKEEVIRKKGLEDLGKAQLKVTEFMKTLGDVPPLEQELMHINKFFDQLQKGVSGGFNLNKERSEAIKFVQDYFREVEELEKLVKEVQATPLIGDDYSDLRGAKIFGEEALREFLEEGKVVSEEFAQFLGDSIAQVTQTGLEDGFRSAASVAANILASTVQQTLTTTIANSFSNALAGGLVGGIAGGIAGFGISAIGDAIFGDSGQDQDQIWQELIDETKKNTEALQKTTENLQKQFTEFSPIILRIKDEFQAILDPFNKSALQGSALPFFGGGQLDISKLSDSTTLGWLRDTITLLEGFPESAYPAKWLEAWSKNIDELEAGLILFNNQMEDFINNTIIATSKDLLETAGDAFRSEAEIQRRKFGKTSETLLLGFVQALEEADIFGEGSTQGFIDLLGDGLIDWKSFGTILLNVTKNTEQYAEALDLVNNLMETAILNEQARADAVRDAMSKSLGGLSNIFDELDFKLSGVSRKTWVEERIKDFEDIFDEVGKLTEDEFSSALGYINEWYDIVVQSEQAAAQAWLNVAEKVETLSDSVSSTIRSITLGPLNVALGGDKTAFAGQEYATLLEAAQTGDEQAINEYLAFSSQYLQVAQDTFKSSEKYRNIYEQVMKDMEELNQFIQSDDFAKLTFETISESLKEVQLSNSILEEIRDQMSTFYTKFASFIELSTAQSHPGGGTDITAPFIPSETFNRTPNLNFGAIGKNINTFFGAGSSQAVEIMNWLADQELSIGGQDKIYDYLHDKGVPGYANEGIAFTPQIATLAERGPEVVLNKSRFDDMSKGGDDQVINIYLDSIFIDQKIKKYNQDLSVKMNRRDFNPGRFT